MTSLPLDCVYTGPVRNGSGPKIGPNRPSVYPGSFCNRSGTDPNWSKTRLAVLQVQFWIHSGPVPEWSRVNTGIGSKQFHVHRSRSGAARVNIALVSLCSIAWRQNLTRFMMLHLWNTVADIQWRHTAYDLTSLSLVSSNLQCWYWATHKEPWHMRSHTKPFCTTTFACPTTM